MEGFTVVTFDDHKVGTVVGRDGRTLVVEHGTVRKHRRALPAVFTSHDEVDDVVRATVSQEVFETAPEAGEDGTFDADAVAEHYGLVGDSDAALTRGYGETIPTDPAHGSEQEGASVGVTPADEWRATIHGKTGVGDGPHDMGPPSPGVTGGDRRRDGR